MNAVLVAFVPTAQQIANWHFFSQLLLGIVAVLFATFWITDRAIDAVVAWRQRRQARRTVPVVDFETRRRMAALKAISEDGR